MICLALFSVAQLVAGGEHPERAGGNERQAYSEDGEAYSRRDVGDAEKSVAETVDQVEERVCVRSREPQLRQGMHRVEHAGEKSKGHDDEVLERRELVDLLGQDAGDQAERAEERGAEDREAEHPERRL